MSQQGPIILPVCLKNVCLSYVGNTQFKPQKSHQDENAFLVVEENQNIDIFILLLYPPQSVLLHLNIFLLIVMMMVMMIIMITLKIIHVAHFIALNWLKVLYKKNGI